MDADYRAALYPATFIIKSRLLIRFFGFKNAFCEVHDGILNERLKNKNINVDKIKKT